MSAAASFSRPAERHKAPEPAKSLEELRANRTYHHSKATYAVTAAAKLRLGDQTPGTRALCTGFLILLCKEVHRAPRYGGVTGQLAKAKFDAICDQIDWGTVGTRRRILGLLKRRGLVVASGTHPRTGRPLMDVPAYRGHNGLAHAACEAAKKTARNARARRQKRSSGSPTPNKMGHSPPSEPSCVGGRLYTNTPKPTAVPKLTTEAAACYQPALHQGIESSFWRCPMLLRQAHVDRIAPWLAGKPLHSLVARWYCLDRGIYRHASMGELFDDHIDRLPGFNIFKAMQVKASIEAWRRAYVFVEHAMTLQRVKCPAALCGRLAGMIQAGVWRVFDLYEAEADDPARKHNQEDQ